MQNPPARKSAEGFSDMNILLFVLCSLLFLYLVYLAFLSVCALLVVKKEYDKESAFYRAVLDNSTRNILKLLRIHVHVTGMEKVPRDTKCLFVSNHRSNYDPIVTWYAFKDWHIAYISKKENFSIPIFGRIIRRCCFMAIDRKNIRNAVPTIRKAGELLKKREVSIGVYPEGTRSRNGVLLPFHDCMFRIAISGEAPIVVLAVSGTEKIFRNIKRLRRSDVRIDVLETIPPSRACGMRSSEIGGEVRLLMENDLKAVGEIK